MLMKQIWRLVNNGDSLAARLLKARYFPNSHIWDANVGRNLSYIWRSILFSTPNLRGGCRWKVGDGKLIDVFKGPWLPDLANQRVQTNVIDELGETKVCALMSIEEKGWEVDIV
ncbi:hypothetical protein Syun_012853 [Stephania yunnanensis]|uniref:Uncharacterized protein n=1 Tax=Stephania yunnanensis TaxID=152371 RepID=A0AAP0PFR2_9MAGN